MNDTDVAVVEVDKLMSDDSLLRSENRKYDHLGSYVAEKDTQKSMFFATF